MKVRTDDLFTFTSDYIIPGKHNQTDYLALNVDKRSRNNT